MLDVSLAEERIGYTFEDKALLVRAFTHSSYAHIHGGEDNERLEYLGDAVLELLVTEAQFFAENQSEGEMTKSRQGLVRQDSLLKAVEAMGVAGQLLVSGGKDNIGGKTVSSLYESILAAVYIDGGMDAARAFLARHPLPKIEDNYKGLLQEFLQKQGFACPVYEVQKHGADNAPTFECTASALGKRGVGSGATKRAAEQQAAKNLLELLKENR
ncbi:MAG: ribonuclease III [Clostridia bacterium]|nr:ribonuclease III [Clostridia bacterium]